MSAASLTTSPLAPFWGIDIVVDSPILRQIQFVTVGIAPVGATQTTTVAITHYLSLRQGKAKLTNR